MGPDPLTLIDVLASIHKKPRRLQSNFVRDNAYEVARLASLGLITTHFQGAYGHDWRCTYKGLRVLEIGNIE